LTDESEARRVLLPVETLEDEFFELLRVETFDVELLRVETFDGEVLRVEAFDGDDVEVRLVAVEVEVREALALLRETLVSGRVVRVVALLLFVILDISRLPVFSERGLLWRASFACDERKLLLILPFCVCTA
jgi:hypothetical protein